MAKLVNLARMTTATTGTGTITLGAAVSGYLSFATAGVSDGDVVAYGIQDGANSEVGYGTYTSSGTTLTRNVTKSTNSDAAIALSGSAQVFVTARAQEMTVMAQPGGRLTLTTATPVMSTSASGATTIYYSPYNHRMVPLWTGSSFQMHDIGGELSQATTDSTKSPAACTTNTNYDLFVWLDGTTYRCTRGPAWSSATARGTGAGTTELERVQGILVNKIAITNGPAARFGTYVGTVRTNGSSQVDWTLGSAAAGGGAASLFVWNMYNRVQVTTMASDSTSSWTYSSATIRSMDNSATNRITFVSGLAEDAMDVSLFITVLTEPAVAAYSLAGIAINSTTAFDHRALIQTAAQAASTLTVRVAYAPQLGSHYFQALEQGDGINNNTLYGSGRQGLTLTWRC